MSLPEPVPQDHCLVQFQVPWSRSFDVAVPVSEGCFSFSRPRRSSVTVAHHLTNSKRQWLCLFKYVAWQSERSISTIRPSLRPRGPNPRASGRCSFLIALNLAAISLRDDLLTGFAHGHDSNPLPEMWFRVEAARPQLAWSSRQVPQVFTCLRAGRARRSAARTCRTRTDGSGDCGAMDSR